MYIYIYIWRFPKIRGTFLGVPVISIIGLGALYGGCPLFRETTIYV